MPIGIESPPPYVQIEQDPHNRKLKLPRSAMEMENKAKKAQVVANSPNTPVEKVVVVAKGKGKGKGKCKH